jgi:4-alpha-glucanotransferase
MQHAGALRIDHVMGLKRLFVFPREHPKMGGAYINYDFEAMLGIVALESQRNRCMVVGEDLGTVPEGFRERLAPERAFSLRVLLFERDHAGGFKSPSEYPRDSVASTGTHDLAPLAGYWHGDDVSTRERLGWEKGEVAERDRSDRERTRDAMIHAFVQHGCLVAPDAEALRMAGGNLNEDQTLMLLVAAHRYLAKTASRLVLMQLEDAVGQRESVNVPGSVHEEPNWRRKLSATVEDLETHDIFSTLAATMRQERPGGQ